MHAAFVRLNQVINLLVFNSIDWDIYTGHKWALVLLYVASRGVRAVPLRTARGAVRTRLNYLFHQNRHR